MSVFLNKIFLEKRSVLRLIAFLIADIFLISFSVLLAFAVRFEGSIPEYYLLNVLGLITSALFFSIPIFGFFKLYSFSWNYVSTQELISMIKAVALSFLFLAASFFILKGYSVFSGFPRSTLFISYFFIFIFCGGIRFAKRVYLQMFFGGKSSEKERTLIVGAGDAGEQILRSILSKKDSIYLPIGFVDDSPAKHGIMIHGLKIFGKIENLPEIILKEKVEGLIIALPSAGVDVIKKAVDLGRKSGIRKIKTFPSLSEIMGGKVSIGSLREVRAEDLLGREPVILDQALVEGFIKDKKVLVTGAAGSIGSELCRQIAKFGPLQMVLLDQDETGIFNISEELKKSFSKLNIISLVMDIIDKEKIDQTFNNFKPDLVFHAAAYKHVPLMEAEPDEAVKNNIFGTKIIVDAAEKYGVKKFILISTDKAINPASVMGATKRIGEMICQSSSGGAKFISVRFGNVLDSRGSVIPIFRDRIKNREPLEVTHPEMKRYFMSISEACLLVLQAGAMGQGGEVFVLDMGEPIKILDLAKEMIRLSGFEPDKDIPIVFTSPRPGEKLFEEILNKDEGIIATKNKKIFISRLSQVNKEKLNQDLDRLKEMVSRGDKEGIIEILKEIIPNYKENKNNNQ